MVNKLLKLFSMPNYDGTVTNMGMLLGTEQAGEEVWLALVLEEVTMASSPAALRVSHVAFEHQHMAQNWLDTWLNSLDELTLDGLTMKTRSIRAATEISAMLTEEKVAAIPFITKTAAGFLINALHDEVDGELRTTMIGGEAGYLGISVQEEQRALRQAEEKDELSELENMLDEQAEREEAELSEVVTRLVVNDSNWGEFA